MKRTTLHTAPKPTPGVLRVSDAELSKAFIASLPAAREGSNSHVAEFLSVVSFLLASGSYRTFRINDVIQLTRRYDLPLDEVESLFSRWIKVAVKNGRVSEVPSCYDGATIFEIV